MSIISCTSPSPSERILPISRVTSRPELVLVTAELLAELADDLAAAGRRPGAPLAEGLDGDGGDPLVVLDRGHADGREHLAGGGVERLDPLAVGRDPGAVEGAGVLGLDPQGFEELGTRCRSCGRSCYRYCVRRRSSDISWKVRVWRGQDTTRLQCRTCTASCPPCSWPSSAPGAGPSPGGPPRRRARRRRSPCSALCSGSPPPGATPFVSVEPGAYSHGRSGSPWRRAPGPRRCRGRGGWR